MSTDHDVLRDPLLSVRMNGGDAQQRATLCDVLAWLSADHTIAFAALQPHQHHPWHAFLVQLGAIAIERSECSALPTKPEAWEELLLGLTAGAREPWCLVVEAPDKPALLQPPVPEKKLDALKNEITTPDALDILVTTRNFDIKGQRAAAGAPEHWMLALVTKQTFEGYVGAKTYGVFRMNGAYGNRPCVALAPSSRWADRFRRDVAVWLEQRDRLEEEYRYDRKGPALLWTLPWDGEKGRSPQGLHPFFVESCLRIRLLLGKHGLVARTGTSATARIVSSDRAGDTGDIWTPVRASSKSEGVEALTVAAAGFGYRNLHELLFGDWQRPPALVLRPSDGDAPVLVAMALARGKGKTQGYHERWIPIPPKARRMLARAEGSEQLGARSQLQLQRATEASRVLKRAVCTLLQGVGDIKPWMDRLDARIDDCFFTELFDAARLDADAARVQWDRVLVGLLERTFSEAIGETPMPDVHRYRTRAAAEARFRAALRKSFPEAIASPRTIEDQAHA